MNIKKIVIAVLLSLCFSFNVFSAEFVSGAVPHYYEFDSDENPSNNYWCGHAALKMAAEYVTGEYKRLNDLHTTMWYNSAYYRDKKVCGSKYCARLLDLYYVAKYSQYNGYGKTNSVLRSVPDAKTFLQKVKDGIINDLPPVADSSFDVSFGHFYVIVGYKEMDNAENTIIYLRDPIEKNPVYVKWDTKTTIKEFLENMNTRQFLFISRS